MQYKKKVNYHIFRLFNIMEIQMINFHLLKKLLDQKKIIKKLILLIMEIL